MTMYGVRCTESLIQRFVWVLHLAECVLVLVPRKQNEGKWHFLDKISTLFMAWCIMVPYVFVNTCRHWLAGFGGTTDSWSVWCVKLVFRWKVWWHMVTHGNLKTVCIRRLHDLIVPYTQMLCIPRWFNGPMPLGFPHSSPKTSGVNTWIGVGAWLLWFGLHSSCWVYLGRQKCQGWAWLDERSVIQ